MNLDNEVNTFDNNKETLNQNEIPKTTIAQEEGLINQDMIDESERKRSDKHP